MTVYSLKKAIPADNRCGRNDLYVEPDRLKLNNFFGL